jgi:hypothetical protein
MSTEYLIISAANNEQFQISDSLRDSLENYADSVVQLEKNLGMLHKLVISTNPSIKIVTFIRTVMKIFNQKTDVKSLCDQIHYSPKLCQTALISNASAERSV